MDIESIKEVLKQSANDSFKYHSNAKWTKILNTKFIEYGHNNKASVYCKTTGADWGEWLYDLTICEQNKKNNIVETKLVMESEWKTDSQSIYEDFQKLVLCNSDFKVMVFYKNKNIFDDLEKQISEYKKSNGIFLLACYTDDEGYLFREVKGNI